MMECDILKGDCQILANKSSRPEMFCKKDLLKISQDSLENTYASLFLKKTSLKKYLGKCFRMNFAKF